MITIKQSISEKLQQFLGYLDFRSLNFAALFVDFCNQFLSV